MNNKFYHLMCKNKELLRFHILNDMISDVEILNYDLLPEMLKVNNSIALHEWLRLRSIDISRSNARLLLKLLKISVNEISPVIYNKALNLTDSYWIKEFENDNFLNLSLYRKSSSQLIIATSLSGIIHELEKGINPELTNIGSFNKAWIKENDEWWLYKRGNEKNIYAEMFAYYLANELGMKIAKYKISNDMIASQNFTDENKMLEHYSSLKFRFKDRDIDDIIIYNNMKELGLDKEYSDILLLDAIICNPDRHEYNFGIIRQSDTGNILTLAPNFDNNLALGASSSLSTYLMEMYLKEIGLQNHQKKYVNKFNLTLFKYIDEKVKSEMNIKMNTENLRIYFNDILKFFY